MRIFWAQGGETVRFFEDFSRYHRSDGSGGAKINYFRSRRVRWFIREVQEKLLTGWIFALTCLPELIEFLEKARWWVLGRFLLALPGAKHPWWVLRPSRIYYTWLVEMENAFSSRRVILYSTMLGQIVVKSGCESFGRKVVNKLGVSKISRDTTDQMVVVAQK